MGSIKVVIDDQTEQRFRMAAMKKFGYGKGAISEAAENALAEWASRVDVDLSSSVLNADPVEMIQGLLTGRGRRASASVELQHETSKIRARRARVAHK
jgi:hypothetical protein